MSPREAARQAFNAERERNKAIDRVRDARRLARQAAEAYRAEHPGVGRDEMVNVRSDIAYAIQDCFDHHESR